MIAAITPKELFAIIENQDSNFTLIDVRNTDEFKEVHIPVATNIPLHILPMRIGELLKNKKIIFICRSGGRSGQATLFAQENGITGYNLTWGMNAFEKEFPWAVIREEKKNFLWLF